MASLRLRRRLACDRGAELIEFALICPLLLLVVFGVIDFGFMFQRYQALTNAAREGARVASIGYVQADVEARVTQYLVASGMPATPTFTYTDSQAVPVGGECITLTGITVTYPYQFMALGGLMGFVGGGSFAAPTLRATALMRSEVAAESCGP